MAQPTAAPSIAAAVLLGSRYWRLLSCDTAAPLSATSAPQPFDSRLDRKHFSRAGGSLLTIMLLFSRSTLLCISAVACPSCVCGELPCHATLH